MAPNPKFEATDVNDTGLKKLVAPQAGPRTYNINWSIVIIYVYIHFAGMYGLYLLVTKGSLATIILNAVTYYITMMSLGAGTHRLWSHHSYKATWSLQLFLMLGHCLSGQYTIFLWIRDHRHPEVKRRGKLVDMSDVLANPLIMFQNRHKHWLNTLFAVVIPTVIPICFWDEIFTVSFHANMLRLALTLNFAFSAASLAHMFGSKPYDKNIGSTQNIVTIITTLGEGFHNYHHTFPQDYKGGENGSYFNFTKGFIDFCAKIGLAYDLKEVSEEVLEKRIVRTGEETGDKYGLRFYK